MTPFSWSERAGDPRIRTKGVNGMKLPVVVLAVVAFCVAVTVQLASHDIPGAFVTLFAAPIAAVTVARSGDGRAAGLLPVVLASVGYFVARSVDGDPFQGYAFIADTFAVLLLLAGCALYAVSVPIASALLRRRR